ncbi:MAG: hypothetical protein RLZZ488_1395 [Pseudomonadota bacterium]|jgi:hypothetical protein
MRKFASGVFMFSFVTLVGCSDAAGNLNTQSMRDTNSDVSSRSTIAASAIAKDANGSAEICFLQLVGAGALKQQEDLKKVTDVVPLHADSLSEAALQKLKSKELRLALSAEADVLPSGQTKVMKADIEAASNASSSAGMNCNAAASSMKVQLGLETEQQHGLNWGAVVFWGIGALSHMFILGEGDFGSFPSPYRPGPSWSQPGIHRPYF